MSRGRTADTPRELPAKGWKDIAFRVKDEVAADRVGLIAAGVAFYGFLAIFPAIAAIMAVSGLFVDPAQVTDQIQSLSDLLPQDIIDIIITQAQAVSGTNTRGLGLTALLGVLIALYSASKGMASLMDGINVAYDEVETRGFFRLKLVTLGLTLFLVFGLLISLGVTLALPVVLSFVDLGGVIEPLVLGLSFITIAILTVIGLSVLYRYGPSRDAPEWSWATVGALVGCILWLTGSVGFAYYVKTFGSYNESFGSLAGVVIMLTWLWLSAFIILLGAELNAEMEAQTRRDTTQGHDLPMGERDAEKADPWGNQRNSYQIEFITELIKPVQRSFTNKGDLTHDRHQRYIAQSKSHLATELKTSDTEPKHIGKGTPVADKETTAQATFDRVKEAIPSFDDVADRVRNQTDVDLQNMADDAATFVRRNPVASVAAAAGIGVLIGILATKRS